MLIIITLISAFNFTNGCGKIEKPPADKGAVIDTQDKKEPPATLKTETQSTDSSQEGGIKNLRYETGDLPSGISYDGIIVAGARWGDCNGENILIITETPEKKQTSDFRMKELLGYHYTVTGDETRLLWKINDFIKDCPVDLTLKYFKGSLVITDLDNNGMAESSFLYRVSCKGDVSPDDMKLLLYEGKSKYAIRGSMKLTIKGEGTYGGEMKVDPSFNNAPAVFLEYAKKQWKKYNEESVGY